MDVPSARLGGEDRYFMWMDLARAARRSAFEYRAANSHSAMYGLQLQNHAGETVARVFLFVQRPTRAGDHSPTARAPWIIGEPELAEDAWKMLDAPEFADDPQEQRHVFERLAATGELPSTAAWLPARFVMPGGGNDEELWITLPVDGQGDADGLGAWSYTNDLGSIPCGTVRMWLFNSPQTCWVSTN